MNIFSSCINVTKLYLLALPLPSSTYDWGKKKGKNVSYKGIKILLKKIEAKNFHQRITQFGLRPDRADVIIHAGKIYLNCMNWSKSQKILVPQSGLADGIIEQLYNNYKSDYKS